MKKLLLSMLLLAAMSYANAQTPAKDVPITVSDGAGGTAELRFGLAPTATDGIDMSLGESELPPVPPSGVFDARFIGTDINVPLGQGVAKDYRAGAANFNGTKIHEISYQLGTGTSITISWNLPGGVSGLLEDLFGGVIVKQTMTGMGSYAVPNPAITKLKMTITYSTTAVEQNSAARPTAYQLRQNYPNPFNPTTTIEFSLPHAEHVTLKIINLAGQEIHRLVDKPFAPGTYQVQWQAHALPSGEYLYQIQAGNFKETKRLILLK
jgi:hypothetical protein